jgi:multisubunit Na+/H+ antiporter MnhC subunit
MQRRKPLSIILALVVITLFTESQLSPALTQGLWEQLFSAPCDLCNGSGKIRHTLSYQILTDEEQQEFRVWTYPAGLYFKVVVTIKNTDDYEGDFSIKETITIGGNPSYETRTLHLASQESGTEFFPTATDWYYAGVLTHSRNLQVTAPQISITCPRCNGTGYVTDLTRVLITAVIVVSAVVVASALVIIRRKRRTTHNQAVTGAIH